MVKKSDSLKQAETKRLTDVLGRIAKLTDKDQHKTEAQQKRDVRTKEALRKYYEAELAN